MTSKNNDRTALESFEAEKAQITRLLVKIQSSLLAYDRDISTVPGGHLNWQHAGTMGSIRATLENVMADISSARANCAAARLRARR